jgi:hypothetical protein
VLLIAFSALSDMEISPLYVDIHPSFEIDFEIIFDDVFFPI